MLLWGLEQLLQHCWTLLPAGCFAAGAGEELLPAEDCSCPAAVRAVCELCSQALLLGCQLQAGSRSLPCAGQRICSGYLLGWCQIVRGRGRAAGSSRTGLEQSSSRGKVQ